MRTKLRIIAILRDVLSLNSLLRLLSSSIKPKSAEAACILFWQEYDQRPPVASGLVNRQDARITYRACAELVSVMASKLYRYWMIDNPIRMINDSTLQNQHYEVIKK